MSSEVSIRDDNTIDISEKFFDIKSPDLANRIKKLYENLYNIKDWNYRALGTGPSKTMEEIKIQENNVKNSIEIHGKLTIVSFTNINCVVTQQVLTDIEKAAKPQHISVHLRTRELDFYFGQLNLCNTTEPDPLLKNELLKRVSENKIKQNDTTHTFTSIQQAFGSKIQEQFALKFSEDFNKLKFGVESIMDEDDCFKMTVHNFKRSDGFNVKDFFNTFTKAIRCDGHHISNVLFDFIHGGAVFEISPVKRKTRNIVINFEGSMLETNQDIKKFKV